MGSKILTVEAINEHLKKRKIRCISYAGRMRLKSTFRCENNHEWSATADSVNRGSGCPHCAGQTRITLQSAKERLAFRGITCITYKPGARSNCVFMCEKLHVWSTSMSKVLNNTGCPHCSRKARLTIDVINNALSDRGITCIYHPGATSKKGTFICTNGHQWEAVVNNVKSHGRGCPYCALPGFKPGEPGSLYILSDDLTSPTFIKIGVANDADKRIAILKNKTPFVIHEVLRFGFETGKEAYEFEQYCHKVLSILNADLKGFDGCTEWFLYNNNLLNWIQNEIKSLPARRCK